MTLSCRFLSSQVPKSFAKLDDTTVVGEWGVTELSGVNSTACEHKNTQEHKIKK